MCERCQGQNAHPHSLTIRVYSPDGAVTTPAGFHLCDACYHAGQDLEPIEDISGFLEPETKAE
jgi:hypothetical protein